MLDIPGRFVWFVVCCVVLWLPVVERRREKQRAEDEIKNKNQCGTLGHKAEKGA